MDSSYIHCNRTSCTECQKNIWSRLSNIQEWPTQQQHFRAVANKLNQPKKKQPPLFAPIVWASICANAQRTRLGKWSPKIIPGFFHLDQLKKQQQKKAGFFSIWISSPVWFTITQHKSLNQHSMGHIGWWQAAFFQHQLPFKVHLIYSLCCCAVPGNKF